MTVDRPGDGAPFYARLAVTGFALFMLGILLILVSAALSDDFAGTLPFAIINWVVAGIAVFVILKFPGWGYVAGALIALLGLVFFSTEIPFRLTSPDAFFDFAAALLAFIG